MQGIFQSITAIILFMNTMILILGLIFKKNRSNLGSCLKLLNILLIMSGIPNIVIISINGESYYRHWIIAVMGLIWPLSIFTILLIRLCTHKQNKVRGVLNTHAKLTYRVRHSPVNFNRIKTISNPLNTYKEPKLFRANSLQLDLQSDSSGQSSELEEHKESVSVQKKIRHDALHGKHVINGNPLHHIKQLQNHSEPGTPRHKNGLKRYQRILLLQQSPPTQKRLKNQPPPPPLYSLEQSREVCLICLKPLQGSRFVLAFDPCGHKFHGQCLMKEFETKSGQRCPACLDEEQVEDTAFANFRNSSSRLALNGSR